MLNDNFSTALANMSDKELNSLLDNVSVFSNVGPEVEEYVSMAYSEIYDVKGLYTCVYEQGSDLPEPSYALAA